MKRWGLIGVVLATLALVWALWWRDLSASDGPPYVLLSAGRLMALTGFTLVFFQCVLSSKIKWIERSIGLDRLFALHRTTGKLGLALLVTHPLVLLAAGRLAGVPIPFLAAAASTLAVLVAAAGAALLYGHVKNLRYEQWKAVHVFNFMVLPLAFMHSLVLGGDLGQPPLQALWTLLGALYVGIVIHKVGNVRSTRRHPYTVTEVRRETPDICSLHFAGRPVRYLPGQFLLVNLVRGGRVAAQHPFTIASSPTRPGLEVSIKASGDFTATIPATRVGDRAYIDVPYGVFTFVGRPERRLVLIAGGIGITPFISMLRYLADRPNEREVLLIWGNKTEADIPFRVELDTLAAAHPWLRVVYVLSKQTGWPGDTGIVDLALLRRLAGEWAGDAAFFVCGPPPMMAGVIGALRALGVPGRRIIYERFALR